MKTIKLSELENIVKEEPNQAKFSKPIIIWFDPPYLYFENRGQVLNILLNVKDFRRNYILNHGDRELVECLRTTPRDRIIVDWSLFYKDEKTDVLIRKTQEEHIQVIFLCGIGELATSKHRCGVNYLDQNFEQFFMPGPSYEEWREYAIQHGFASELIQYMDNHQELYIKSPTDDDLPQESVAEQWHILENLSSDMKEWIDENSNPAFSRRIQKSFKILGKYV